MKRYLILALLFPLLAFSQVKTVTYLYDASAQHADRPIDISHVEAYVKIDPFDSVVSGRVTFSFRPLAYNPDSVVFYVQDFDEIDVFLNERDAKTCRDGSRLVIYLGGIKNDEDNELIFNYTARPKYEFFFVGWNEPAERDRKAIWSHRPHHWLPYYQDRLTVDMYITFDGKYSVFSNGIRKSVKNNKDGTKTWHYAMESEHPYFSTALVIGNYDYTESVNEKGLPLEMWYYEGEESRVEPTYRYMNDMFTYFEEELGFAYPYELYRQAPVPDYLYGAMETTTSTIFGDYMLVNDSSFHGRSYVNVNAHELAHQWFGNCLSHLNNRDIWLTESFGTYYAKMFEKYVYGEERYEEIRLQELKETMEAAERDPYSVGHGRGGRARWYPKGSLVMDMLRDVLGEENFKKSVQHYLLKHQFSVVETSDFLAAIREASGYDMTWFFDQWILRGGEPHLRVDWNQIETAEGGSLIRLNTEQVQPVDDLTGLFNLPVEVQLWYRDGTYDSYNRMIKKKTESFLFQADHSKQIAFILFDPGERILKTIDFRKSYEELAYQVKLSENLRDRYEGLVALRGYPINQKKDLLNEIYGKEDNHLLRAEILNQLPPEEEPGLYALALEDADVYTRRAALKNLKNAPGQLEPGMIKCLSDVSYINVELALRALYNSFPSQYGRYLEATRGIKGWRGLNVRMAWLEIAILEGQREYLRELVSYSAPDQDFETRINAMLLLQKLNYLNEESAKNLLYGVSYWNYKVSNAAKDVTGYFLQQEKMKRLLVKAYRSNTWDGDQQQKISRILQQ